MTEQPLRKCFALSGFIESPRQTSNFMKGRRIGACVQATAGTCAGKSLGNIFWRDRAGLATISS